jgi:hypothetical protein
MHTTRHAFHIWERSKIFFPLRRQIPFLRNPAAIRNAPKFTIVTYAVAPIFPQYSVYGLIEDISFCFSLSLKSRSIS